MSTNSTAVARAAADAPARAAGRDAAPAKFPIFGTAAVLFLAAVLAYAPLIGWGIPEANAPDRTKTVATDEILPLEGLAEMHNTFVISKPDRNYGYPWFHYFETAVFQAPYLAYARLTGQFGKPSPDFPFGFRDPVAALRWLTWIGRFLSVLMGAGTVVSAFVFARNIWGERAGILTAILTLLSYPMMYYSRTGNPDEPAAFWTSLGLVAYSLILKEGLTAKRGVWLGIFAGVAMATKDQAVLVFIPLGISLMFGPRKSWWTYASALTASVAAYIIATGMIVDPHRHIEHVYRLLFNPNSTNSMGFYRPGHPKSWQGTLEMTAEFFQGMSWMYSLPVLLMAAAGAWLTGRKTPRLLALLAPLVLLYFCLILPVRTVVLRYFLPMTPIVCGFAAYALVSLGRSRLHRFTIAFTALLCGWELAIAADLAYAQAHETRLSAASWFEAHATASDRIEYFGVREAMPPLPAFIESRRIAGRIEWKKESGHGPRILKYLVEGGPKFLFIAPDVTSKPGVPYSGDCPPEVYKALLHGRTAYRQAATFATPTLLPPWFRRPRLDYPTVAPPVRLFVREHTAIPGGRP